MKNTENENLTMTYSSLLLRNGKKAICVRFERPTMQGNDYAEAILPDCKVIAQNGFSSDELAQLEIYLKMNKDDILQKSKDISSIMHWF